MSRPTSDERLGERPPDDRRAQRVLPVSVYMYDESHCSALAALHRGLRLPGAISYETLQEIKQQRLMHDEASFPLGTSSYSVLASLASSGCCSGRKRLYSLGWRRGLAARGDPSSARAAVARSRITSPRASHALNMHAIPSLECGPVTPLVYSELASIWLVVVSPLLSTCSFALGLCLRSASRRGPTAAYCLR